MTFPNLSGPHNAQRRANLERAFEEIAYYSRRLWQSGKGGITAETLAEIETQIETARPETAGEIFTRFWHLCRELEKILSITGK
jgi:hypothetical protein